MGLATIQLVGGNGGAGPLVAAIIPPTRWARIGLQINLLDPYLIPNTEPANAYDGEGSWNVALYNGTDRVVGIYPETIAIDETFNMVDANQIVTYFDDLDLAYPRNEFSVWWTQGNDDQEVEPNYWVNAFVIYET